MDMPIVVPVRIVTKGKSWFRRLWIWLSSRRNWRMVGDFTLSSDIGTLRIPAGFVFDGASIPRVFWWFLSPTGILFIPAIFHDYMYSNGVLLYLDADGVVCATTASRKFADDTFLKLNKEINGVWLADLVSWVAVRIGGMFAYKGKKNE